MNSKVLIDKNQWTYRGYIIDRSKLITIDGEQSIREIRRKLRSCLQKVGEVRCYDFIQHLKYKKYMERGERNKQRNKEGKTERKKEGRKKEGERREEGEIVRFRKRKLDCRNGPL